MPIRSELLEPIQWFSHTEFDNSPGLDHRTTFCSCFISIGEFYSCGICPIACKSNSKSEWPWFAAIIKKLSATPTSSACQLGEARIRSWLGFLRRLSTSSCEYPSVNQAWYLSMLNFYFIVSILSDFAVSKLNHGLVIFVWYRQSKNSTNRILVERITD